MNSINKPFLLKPAAKDYLWGGNRLNDDFGKEINVSPLAETWECSTHPDGLSFVGSGNYVNKTLKDVLKMHPEFLGSHAANIADGKFPILIKFIDANSDLSVQVHPDDEYALKNENSLGKTEMWYVLSARKDSQLVYGFKNDMDPEQVKKHIENNTIVEQLNTVSVEKDDVFMIEPGTVHAIGAGTLVAEIQENSNITYRLYDYNRIDKNGKQRELNIDKALDVANLKSSISPRQPMRTLKYRNGYASELLARCRYFQVERVLLNTEINRNMCNFKTDSNSFHVLLCIEGCGNIFGEDTDICFFKGDCIFVPAESIELKLHGKAQFLNVSC